MKNALKAVLESLSTKDRRKLSDLVQKMAEINNSKLNFPCHADCDGNLARINLCPHCQVTEQLLEPLSDVLLGIWREEYDVQ